MTLLFIIMLLSSNLNFEHVLFQLSTFETLSIYVFNSNNILKLHHCASLEEIPSHLDWSNLKFISTNLYCIFLVHSLFFFTALWDISFCLKLFPFFSLSAYDHSSYFTEKYKTVKREIYSTSFPFSSIFLHLTRIF